MEKLDRYHLLITGPSGAGKTYFAKALGELGYPVQDSDHIPGLGYFVDNETREYVEFNPLGDLEWFKKHTFVWNREVLEKFLAEKDRMIICGGTTDLDQFADLFDHIFYLKVEKQDILANLKHESRENAYGKTLDQQKWASEGIDMFNANIPQSWIPLISRDPKELVSEIEKNLHARLI